MASFKVRRKLRGTGGARFGSSGSYTDFDQSGQITQAGTAEATFNKVTVPSGGTTISGILSGSVTISTSSLAADTTESVNAAIASLTNAYKIFLTPAGSLGGNMFQGAEAGSGSVKIWYRNASSAATADVTEVWYYFAALDE